jgi:heme/copper-type cytochrome/quinol oxidase subunit 1
MMTGLSGAALATMMRLELAHPGSPFFKGDSLRYLQVITTHGLIMVFFVVVPILFGAFANFSNLLIMYLKKISNDFILKILNLIQLN